MRWLRSHKDKKHEPIRPRVFDSMLLPGPRDGNVIFTQLPFPCADLEQASSADDEIDFVRPFMSMRGLRLTRLEAIEITEKPLGLKEAVLFHFVRRELHYLRNILPIHTPLLRGRILA